MGKESVSRLALALAAGFILSACDTTDDGDLEAGFNPDEPPTPVEEDMLSGQPYIPIEECPADAFQALVGQQVSEVDTDILPNLTRIIGPDLAVTMDFRPDRMNVYYDEEGEVTEVRCG